MYFRNIDYHWRKNSEWSISGGITHTRRLIMVSNISMGLRSKDSKKTHYKDDLFLRNRRRRRKKPRRDLLKER